MRRRKIPGFEALLAFEAAARHESFTRAADELALTQSAVGRQVLLLEEYLGVPLFHRVKRRVHLTETGAAYARAIRDDLARIERHTLAAMASRAAGGSLDIAVIPTFATRWLIPRLPQFCARHRDVTVNLAAHAELLLLAGPPWENIDAAIHFGVPSQPGVVAEYLFGEEMIAVSSPALRGAPEPLPPCEIQKLPLLHSAARPDAWRLWFDRAGIRLGCRAQEPRYELLAMLVEAARAGLGVALVPRFLVTAELEQGVLVIVSELSLQTESGYYFVHPEGKQSSPGLAAFKNWLIEQAVRQRAAHL